MRWFSILGVLGVVFTAWYAIAQITDEVIESDGYHRYPGGIAIGDETRHFGCLNWSQADLCFFIDLNCDYIKQPEERTMCECECASTTTTTSSSTSTSAVPTTSVPTTTTTSTSNTSTTSTTAPGATSTTSTSTTSSTSTTVADSTFADGLCTTILGLRPEDDGLVVWISPSDNEKLYKVACHCEGTCSAPRAEIQLTDGMGQEISTVSPLTCGTGTGSSTYVDITDPDRQLDKGERLVLNVTNSPASYDRINVCVTFEP